MQSQIGAPADVYAAALEYSKLHGGAPCPAGLGKGDAWEDSRVAD
jgi:hypothetical protein